MIQHTARCGQDAHAAGITAIARGTDVLPTSYGAKEMRRAQRVKCRLPTRLEAARDRSEAQALVDRLTKLATRDQQLRSERVSLDL